uniref:Zgc:153292 [Danio rerio] n=1 Tax=Lepeophtheirus salmonis TaxID=72036 RepID=A0A0K2VC50_LEPSM
MLCCCPGCKSGTRYRGKKKQKIEAIKNRAKVSFHKLPKDLEILSTWLRRIPRKNWKPNNNTRICSNHFDPSCFIIERVDSNSTRKKKGGNLKHQRLKPDAIPTMFPNLPSYLSTPAPTMRSTSCLSTERLIKQETQIKNEKILLLEKDKVKTLSQILEKIDTTLIPTCVNVYKEEKCLIYYGMKIESDTPKIKFNLTIKDDLTYTMKIGKFKIPRNQVLEICPHSNIDKISQVHNILVFLNTYPHQPDKIHVTEGLLEILNEYLSTSSPNTHLESIREQLYLHPTHKNGRKYSTKLLDAAVLWQNMCPALYNQILASGLLILPTVQHIRRIKRSVKAEVNLNKIQQYEISPLDENILSANLLEPHYEIETQVNVEDMQYESSNLDEKMIPPSLLEPHCEIETEIDDDETQHETLNLDEKIKPPILLGLLHPKIETDGLS